MLQSFKLIDDFQSELQTLLPRNPFPVESKVYVKIDISKIKKQAETLMWGFINGDKEQLAKIKIQTGYAMLNYFDASKENMTPAVPHHLVRLGHVHKPRMDSYCKGCKNLAIAVKRVRA